MRDASARFPLGVLGLLLVSTTLHAAITAAPNSVSMFPSQTSAAINLTLTFPAATAPGSGTIGFTGLPFGAFTIPDPVTYTYETSDTSTTASFAIGLSSGVQPGTYSIGVGDRGNLNAGSTTITLTVLQPTFTATAAPNPLNLAIGGAPQNVTVTTNADPGFTSQTIDYAFTGFPNFILNDGPKSTGLSNYPPVTFTFSLGAGATPGTYPGTLLAQPLTGGNRAFPFTVIIAQPDIAASFAQPTMQICNGTRAGVSNSIQLTPINYSGTPTLRFVTVPAGITITPVAPTANPMPPGQSIPFTVQANGASPAVQTAMLNISDPSANINKNITLTLDVADADFTPAVAPASINLTPGGASQTVSASLAPNRCMAGDVTVTPSGLPAGIAIAPISTTLAGPAYPSGSFTLQAASNAALGTYTATFTYATAGGLQRTAPLTVNVAAAPDFALSVAPPSLSIPQGGTGTLQVSATGFNGFQGTVDVTSPAMNGITFVPSVFTLMAGQTQPVAVNVAPNASLGTFAATFFATATGTSGTRTATTNITIASAPDFTLSANPSALTLQQGGTGSTTVTVNPLNGFTGLVNIQASGPGNVILSPQLFTLAAGASQPVTITLTPGIPVGTVAVNFVGSSANVTGSRSASLSIVVTPGPDFAINVTPSSLTIREGTSGSVTVGAAGMNGFSGAIAVTAPTIPGVVFSPATFALGSGTTQVVSISVLRGTAAGTLPATFTATALNIPGSRTATLVLNVSPRPDFSISVSPLTLAIRHGSNGVVTVGANGINDFSGAINVAAPAIPHVTFTPTAFDLQPGESRDVTIAVSPLASLQLATPAVFRATAAAVPDVREATLLLSILPPAPVLTSLTPPAAVAGTRSLVLRVLGEFFQAGTRFESLDQSLTIEGSQVLTPNLADLGLSVRSDAPPGRYAIRAINPDGGASSQIFLLVYPPSSIAAPLDVTAAAIVFPAEGTLLAAGEALYPRGLLATTGTGTIVGSWHFDGVPFDRFVVNAAGGMPVEVTSRVPIPISFAGGHHLTLVVEQPAHAVSPAINVIETVDRVSRLTIFAPRDGETVSQPLFRWSLVPNCSGFLVEIVPRGGLETPLPDAVTPALRFRVSDPEWAPTPDDLAALGLGIHRWRVRAVCAGETETEPTPWHRVAILPQDVAISLLPTTIGPGGRPLVSWRSEVSGLLYRIEIIAPDGRALYSALSSRFELTIPAAVGPIPAGARIRITAFGPGGHILGTAESMVAEIIGARPPRAEILLAQWQAISISSVEPADGSIVRTDRPRIAAQWRGAARAGEVSLILDQTDVTAVATIDATSIVYDSILPLGAGAHTVSLSVADQSKSWIFVVEAAAQPVAPEPTAPTEVPGETAKPERRALRTNWSLMPLGTLTVIRDANENARTQLSAQTDLDNGAVSTKATGDISIHHDFDTERTVQESRNWLTQFGATQGAVREELRVGYAPPDFLDQSQLITTGLARGGAQGKVFFPIGIGSYYETYGTRPAGIVAGNFGPEQKIRAASFQIPASDRWDFRLLGLTVEDEPGFNSAGGEGDVYGIFSRFTLGPKMNLIFEGARGSFAPNPGSLESDREGNALRIGINGMLGTMTYAVNLRNTEAEFVNPANRGFTPGGVPDRAGGDVSLTRMFGRSSISVQLRRLQDGNSSGAIVPRTRETSGNVSFTTMMGSFVSLSLSGNITADSGEGRPEIFIPKSDREQRGATGTLSETFGRFNFTQTLALQELRDHENASNDQEITSATLTAGGNFFTNLNLAGVLSGTRSEGSAAIGTTDQLLFSFQPSIAIPRLAISLQPRAMYSWSKSDLTDFETKNETYQGLITINPPWLRSLLSVQLSADWSRSRFTGQLVDASFDKRYVGTLSLRWGLGRSSDAGAPTPLPGEVPTQPPSDAPPTPVARARANPIGTW